MTAAGLPGIGRRAAQELARRELSKSIYQPSVTGRILNWLSTHLDRLFNAINTSLPGGWWALASLLVVAVVFVSAVLLQVRPRLPHRSGRGHSLSEHEMSAGDHRALADGYASAGDYSAAIIERVRAAAAELQERGVLPARPGRTADEFAAEASLSLPKLAGQLADGARMFDDIRYGGRTGTSVGYEHVRDLDNAIRVARLPAAMGAGSATSAGAGSADATSAGAGSADATSAGAAS